MAAVDPAERFIVARLQPHLQKEGRSLLHLLQKAECRLVKAIGPGSYHHLREGEGLFIKSRQLFRSGIGVGERLEIGDEPLTAEPPFSKNRDSLFDLPPDRLHRAAAVRAEAGIAAEGATARRHLPSRFGQVKPASRGSL